MSTRAIFTEEYFISANEGNAQGELGMQHLVGAIIDIATHHANALHIGNPDMRELEGGWVLSRLTIEMDRYPRVNEKYRLSTWVESFNRRFSERNFRIEDERGNILGYASSIWMIIHTETHEPLALSHFHLDESLICGEPVPIPRSGRHRPIFEAAELDKPATALVANAPVAKYRFKYCDVDYYRHVNTVRYIVLLLNQYDLGLMDRMYVRRFELSFMREGAYGMTTDILRYYPGENVADSYFALAPEGVHGEPLLFARILLMER